MFEDVVKRLQSLGYETVPEKDGWFINHLIEKVNNTIKNECNVSAVPEGLKQIAVNMVCGEFLQMKKGSGQLEGFDVEAAVKQVQEGDTSVTFAVSDNSVTLDGLISYLMNNGKSQFIAYRRLRW